MDSTKQELIAKKGICLFMLDIILAFPKFTAICSLNTQQ